MKGLSRSFASKLLLGLAVIWCIVLGLLLHEFVQYKLEGVRGFNTGHHDSGLLMLNGLSVECVSVDDKFGSYNEVPITPYGCSWSDTFGADGWVVDSSNEGEYSFIIITNDKYTAYSDFFLFNKSHEHATLSEIQDEGFYGYDIQVLLPTEDVPNMTWNGLGFGASYEDVLDAYGEPYYTSNYISRGMKYCRYEYYDGDVELKFGCSDKEGLVSVELWVRPQK